VRRRDGEGRPGQEAPRHHVNQLDSQTVARDRARARLREQDRRRAIGREAERLMPLVRFYGPRPLLAVPIGDFYVRGRWAA
jgi:hypothetical protein